MCTFTFTFPSPSPSLSPYPPPPSPAHIALRSPLDTQQFFEFGDAIVK